MSSTAVTPKDLQVLNHRLTAHPQVGATQFLRHLRVAHGHTAHVRLVDDRAIPRRAGRLIVAPGKGRLDDHALREITGAVARIQPEVRPFVSVRISAQDLVPAHGPGDRLGVRIQEELLRIEAMALLGRKGAMDAVAVELARPQIRQKRVPDLVRALAQRNARALVRALGRVKEAQLHGGGVLGENGEVDAVTGPGGAQRKGIPRPDAHAYGPARIPAIPCKGMPTHAGRLFISYRSS